MRIADNMTFDQVRGNLGKNRTQMSDLQNQAATQKRVTKPSDDPVAASRVLASRLDLQGNRQFVKNVNYAKSFLEITDQALQEVTDNLVRAKELALNQANDASASGESRRAVATEIRQILGQLASVGNRKLGERFIFGGFKTLNRPFDQDGKYQGDSGEMLLHIDKETFLPMNIAGNQVFLGEGLSADGVVHSTQQQARTIEDFLEAEEKAGEGAPAAKPTEPAPHATGPEVEMRAPASKSILGGQKETKVSGGINLFSVLQNLEISLRTNDKAGIQESLDDIDKAVSQVVLARANVGSRGMAVDSLLQGLEKGKVDSQISISQFEDADIFSTVSDINKTQSTLQATLETSGKIIQPSLLQFLR